MGDLLVLAFIFLCAGVVAVPLATRLGLGSVLGYLLAGIALGPLLSALEVDVASIQHFAEFGVVMMLFLVGLELEPKTLWAMRSRLLGLGGLQVALSSLLILFAATALGFPWTVGLAAGFVLSLSSTAIVLQTLDEKGLMRSDGGQAGFSVLLFQDIAVIPMLAVIPLLAAPELLQDVAPHAADHEGHGGGEHGGFSLVEGLPGWLQAVVTLAAIGAVVLGGSLLTRPVFNFIALARLREIFVAAALLLVIGIALLMTLVGLSPALGVFLAGVVLANSEYRHELESDIEPFKGLLLGLFFITVGASIDFGMMGAELGTILAWTAALMAIKGAVLLGLAVVFGIRGADRWLFTLSLAHAGEFAFVLLAFAQANAAIPPELADRLLLVAALSMLATPLLFILYDRLLAPRFVGAEAEDEADDLPQGAVLIAGHGRFGGIVNRMLRGLGHEPVVLDYSASQLEVLRTFGFRVYYGDATRPELLHAAGIETAKMLVVAIDEREQITKLVRYVTQNHPHVHVVARAKDRPHVYELYAAGARDIIRETFDSGVRAGRSALEALGMHPYEAERKARQFIQNDRRSIVALASVYNPDVPLNENAEYVARARQLMAENEALMRGEGADFAAPADRAWSPPSLEDVDEERARAAETPKPEPGG